MRAFQVNVNRLSHHYHCLFYEALQPPPPQQKLIMVSERAFLGSLLVDESYNLKR